MDIVKRIFLKFTQAWKWVSHASTDLLMLLIAQADSKTSLIAFFLV